MNQPEDIVVVNGPTVDVYRPESESPREYSPSIVYSVQLSDGSIVTSPDRFPTECR
ncbi:MAG: hypothetical protein ABSE53_08105 [Terracidiphilus sp.]|jgi:hypothetical protein